MQIPAEGKARDVAVLVRDIMRRICGQDPYTGGCRTFYTPEEWAAKGEQYGLRSALVITYDGSEVGDFFEYDRLRYDRIDAMDAALREAGYYAEACTRWHAAVYSL